MEAFTGEGSLKVKRFSDLNWKVRIYTTRECFISGNLVNKTLVTRCELPLHMFQFIIVASYITANLAGEVRKKILRVIFDLCARGWENMLEQARGDHYCRKFYDYLFTYTAKTLSSSKLFIFPRTFSCSAAGILNSSEQRKRRCVYIYSIFISSPSNNLIMWNWLLVCKRGGDGENKKELYLLLKSAIAEMPQKHVKEVRKNKFLSSLSRVYNSICKNKHMRARIQVSVIDFRWMFS